MIVSEQEFTKVALEIGRVTVGIIDGKAQLFVIQNGIGSVAYFLGTTRGDVRTFKSFGAVRSFLRKNRDLLECDLHLNYSDI